jgi:hypothetical protein
MKIIILISMIVQAFLNPVLNKDPNIKFEYIGDSDKPIHIIIFFVNKYEKHEPIFTDTFKISKSEYDSLGHFIINSQKLFEKVEIRFYKITVFNGVSEKIYFVRDKQKISKVFDQTIYLLRFSKQKDQIRNGLIQILKRV